MLQDDAFDGVADSLATVGAVLQDLKKFLHLDDGNRVARTLKELCNPLIVSFISLVLEGLNVEKVLLHALGLLQHTDRQVYLFG
jgi:hypothetical protein